MKTAFTILLSFFLWINLAAQSISVASFSLLENDLTANTAGTTMFDQNGEKCALIKVETTQTGFTFDVGSLGVIKTEQHTAEIWVYVPAGVKRISIAHQQLGRLNDYDLGMTLQRSKTYRLKLTTGTVTTVVEEAVTNQFLLFQVNPANATIMVNNEIWTVSEGVARKYVPFGTYDYRVMAQDYIASSGKVVVNDPVNKHVVNVNLKPNFTQVTVNAKNNAEIWINDELKGVGSWTGNLGAGEYLMEARLDNHRASKSRKTVTLENASQSFTLEPPTPIYGKLLVNTLPDMAEIYVDGQKVGETPLMLQQVLIGSHEVTLKKYGYRDYAKRINISEGQTTTLDGSLDKGYEPRIITVNGVSFNMIPVEGGTFQMGATSEQVGAKKREKPVHSVTLSDYYIGETEVTQQLWEAVMGKNPSDYKDATHPVEMVSWKQCKKFIKRLNKLTGLSFRLPTEAEWEYAARGGSKHRGNRYAGSSDYQSVACCSAVHHQPVKHFQPNELGLYDMSGNVGEWCQDVYGGYSKKSKINPVGKGLGYRRVYRGGVWNFEPKECRVSCRYHNHPGDNDDSVGLRLAL